MLILARKPGERIKINDDIVLTVISIQGQQVRIGIDAPKGMSIDREEVRAKKDANIARLATL